MLDKIFREGYEYRRVGVILGGLVPTSGLTQRLFDNNKFEQWRNLMRAIDEINKKFCKDTIRFGCVKTNGVWKMKQLRRSPRYTTNWDEVLTVH